MVSATDQVETATQLADTRTLDVHQASRLFIDWLSTDAADKRLDSLTLRRIALLEVARARRSQGMAALSLVLGSLLLFTAHIAATVRDGIVRLPDTTLDYALELSKSSTRRKTSHRLPNLRSATAAAGPGAAVRRTTS